MKSKEKDRYMKRIVRYCIGATTALLIIGIVLAVIGYDVLNYVTVGIGVFGGELLLTCIIKLIGDKESAEEKKENG